MEGSLEGMLYKLHIRVLPSPSHENLIRSMGTGSKIDGTRSLEIWHQRLYHLNYPTILAMDQTKAVTGMILQNKHTPEFCQGCVFGKSHRHSFVSQPFRTPSSTPGYLVHANICGPMAHASLGGVIYYLLFKYDYSEYRYILCIVEKFAAFHCSRTSTTTFFVTLGTICRFFALMEVMNSTARSFKNIFSSKKYST
jgi:hypothetical protein